MCKRNFSHPVKSKLVVEIATCLANVLSITNDISENKSDIILIKLNELLLIRPTGLPTQASQLD